MTIHFNKDHIRFWIVFCIDMHIIVHGLYGLCRTYGPAATPLTHAGRLSTAALFQSEIYWEITRSLISFFCFLWSALSFLKWLLVLLKKKPMHWASLYCLTWTGESILLADCCRARTCSPGSPYILPVFNRFIITCAFRSKKVIQ